MSEGHFVEKSNKQCGVNRENYSLQFYKIIGSCLKLLKKTMVSLKRLALELSLDANFYDFPEDKTALPCVINHEKMKLQSWTI